MELGDVFLIGEGQTVILDEMYVYICDHPWPQTNSIACVPVKSTSDTPVTRDRKLWVFLKKSSPYTIIAKHSEMRWVEEKKEWVEHLFQTPEFLTVLEEVMKQDPETKEKIRKLLKGKEDKDR